MTLPCTRDVGVWAEVYAEERGDVPPSQESDLCYYLYHFLLQATIIGYTIIVGVIFVN